MFPSEQNVSGRPITAGTCEAKGHVAYFGYLVAVCIVVKMLRMLVLVSLGHLARMSNPSKLYPT